jgi:hypothetical protein
VDENGSHANDLGGAERSDYRVPDEALADALSLTFLINRHAPYDYDWNRIWHVAPDLSGGLSVSYGAGGEAIESDDAFAIGHDIGAACAGRLVGESFPSHPLVE